MFASSLRSVCRNGLAGARGFSSTAAASAAEVKSLGVIGAGQMVSHIALVAAQKANVPVTLIDNSQASLDKGLKFAGNSLQPRHPHSLDLDRCWGSADLKSLTTNAGLLGYRQAS
jgi:3-hydroxybutyryl-CoA dehydrogenase